MTESRVFTRITSFASLILLLLVTQTSLAARLNDIRIWHAPDRSRIVLDMDQAPQFKQFYLASPSRFVVDLPGFRLGTRAPENANSGPYLSGIRIGRPDASTARIVLDLKEEVTIKPLLLAPVPGYGHRLVLDVYPKTPGKKGTEAVAGKTPAPNKPLVSPAPGKTQPAPVQPVKKPDDTIIVAIDAGHGGEDSGARGRRTKEKDVVLQVAKRLQKKINAQKGMKAILTRQSDYFVSLRDRTKAARKAGADLFISIHADGFKNAKARGSSVYALSLRGASSEEARWMADKENAADLAGGVSISARDDSVAKVLLTLSMDATLNESYVFAQSVLRELKKIGKVHNSAVEKAGFVVLKSPDIPSILVETAYITNPAEEKLLRSASHQEKLANAILIGAKNYLRQSTYHTAGSG